MTDLRLRRFWFPVPGHLGIGITAYTEDEAKLKARELAEHLRWSFDASGIMPDIDIRDLDQAHVVPNMKPPSLRGVWFPMGF